MRTPRPQSYSAVQAAIGTRMRWVREVHDIGQAEAARLMGIHDSTLAKIETGDRAASIFNVIEFSVRFRVGADFLLRGALTDGTDRDVALKLVAKHPEIISKPAHTAPDTPDTRKKDGRFRYRQPRSAKFAEYGTSE